MRIKHGARGLDFWSKRLWPAPFSALCHARFAPSGETRVAAHASLDEFLVERYVLYSKRGDQLFRGRVFHEPYEIQEANVSVLRESCLRAAGFERPQNAPHILFSRGVDVEVWDLERC